MTDKRKSNMGKAALFCATLIWGSSFFIMKNTVDSIDTYYLIAIRFFVGAALLSLIFCKRFTKLKNVGEYLSRGALMGGLLFGAYAFQTYGVMHTTPGKNAFLTAAYCILVPFLDWIFVKKRPNGYNIAAAFVCFLGIGFISLNRDFSINIGDLLTLVAALFFGLHMVALGSAAQGRDVIVLSALQFAFAGVISLVFGMIFNEVPRSVPREAVWSMVYLCVGSTTVALLLQSIGQKYVPPSAASIILSSESVFGVLFSVIFYKEVISLKTAVGFVIVLAAVMISETRLEFLRRRRIKVEA